MAILGLGSAVQSRAGVPGIDAGRSRRSDGHRRPRSVPTGNRQDAQPHTGDAAQMGGSTGTETGGGFVVLVTAEFGLS